jgi:RNA polymerase sigma-70 factor (ECF subfamily)
LRTWLTRIVINHALARLRSRKRDAGLISMDRVVNVEPHLEVAPGCSSTRATPEEMAIWGESRRLLEQLIDDLPPAFRIVFVMRAVEEMSVEETAECLGIPEATVRTRYFRARQLLRRSFADEPRSGLQDAFAFDGDRCDRIVRQVLSRVGVNPPESVGA